MKKKLDMDSIVDWWLFKYHGVHLKDVYEPEWEENSRPFYAKYPVTDEQHDEWREWLIKSLMKENRRGRKWVERGLWVIYLNTAPMVNK